MSANNGGPTATKKMNMTRGNKPIIHVAPINVSGMLHVSSYALPGAVLACRKLLSNGKGKAV
jgi:hypothetical protein